MNKVVEWCERKRDEAMGCEAKRGYYQLDEMWSGRNA